MAKKTSTANAAQLEAIHHTEGPLQIIAGPGSGKTFTLVERIVHIVEKHKVEPKNFLVVTFTEKAAKELKTRIGNKFTELGLDLNVNEMVLGTFHGVCLELLEQHREFTRLKRNYTVMDQFDQQYFLYQKMKHFYSVEDFELITGDPDKTSKWKQSQNLLKWINKVSEEAISVQSLLEADEEEMVALGNCYARYQHLLDDANTLDFSTIQTETLKLLRDHPEVKQEVQEQIRFVMVDEYQDTNSIQELLLKEIVNSDQNICVVGDDDQGLYRFRGASIRNILEFEKEFNQKACKQVRLDINYRSHPDIVDFYNEWMESYPWSVEGETFRFDKTIKAQDDKEFTDVPSTIKIPAPCGEDWPGEVKKFLMAMRESGKLTNWNQVAFLFRSVKSDLATELARRLEEEGIPVYSPRSNLFFERHEIRLMFGALLFMFPQCRKLRSFTTKGGKEISMPIWEEYYDHCLRLFAEELRKPENERLKNWAAQKAHDHLNLAYNTDYSFLGLFYQLLEFKLFGEQIAEVEINGQMDERPIRNLSIFSQLLAKFEYLHHITVLTPKEIEWNLINLFSNYIRYLMDGGISEYEDDSEYAPSGCVSFMTIHQSKGLEFPVVIVDSLNTTPRKQYTEIDEIIENGYLNKDPFEPLEYTKYFDFMRLYYTAYSRAQNVLVLTCQEENRKGKKKVPTKWFADFYDKLPSWEDASFDMSKLELEHVKPVNLKNEYAFTTHINIYENCAQQYRFFKEYKFNPVRTGPILFGTLVHETIEDIHKAVLRGEEEIITDEQIEAWFRHNYEVISKAERVYLNQDVQTAALNQVIRYYHREKANFHRLKEAEVEVSFVKEDYILKGKVDLITGENDSIEIIDFKSEKKPDLEAEHQRLSQYQRQLEVYAHIIEGRYGLPVTKMHLYYTSEEDGNPFVTFDREDSKIDDTIDEINNVVARIEKKDFTIEERPLQSCKNCDMRFHCGDKYKQAS